MIVVCMCTVCVHPFLNRIPSLSHPPCNSFNFDALYLNTATQVKMSENKRLYNVFIARATCKINFCTWEKIVPIYCNSHHAKWGKRTKCTRNIVVVTTVRTLVAWQTKNKNKEEINIANITNTHEWTEMHALRAPIARKWTSERAERTNKEMKMK